MVHGRARFVHPERVHRVEGPLLAASVLGRSSTKQLFRIPDAMAASGAEHFFGILHRPSCTNRVALFRYFASPELHQCITYTDMMAQF